MKATAHARPGIVRYNNVARKEAEPSAKTPSLALARALLRGFSFVVLTERIGIEQNSKLSHDKGKCRKIWALSRGRINKYAVKRREF